MRTAPHEQADRAIRSTECTCRRPDRALARVRDLDLVLTVAEPFEPSGPALWLRTLTTQSIGRQAAGESIEPVLDGSRRLRRAAVHDIHHRLHRAGHAVDLRHLAGEVAPPIQVHRERAGLGCRVEAGGRCGGRFRHDRCRRRPEGRCGFCRRCRQGQSRWRRDGRRRHLGFERPLAAPGGRQGPGPRDTADEDGQQSEGDPRPERPSADRLPAHGLSIPRGRTLRRMALATASPGPCRDTCGDLVDFGRPPVVVRAAAARRAGRPTHRS